MRFNDSRHSVKRSILLMCMCCSRESTVFQLAKQLWHRGLGEWRGLVAVNAYMQSWVYAYYLYTLKKNNQEIPFRKILIKYLWKCIEVFSSGLYANQVHYIRFISHLWADYLVYVILYWEFRITIGKEVLGPLWFRLGLVIFSDRSHILSI